MQLVRLVNCTVGAITSCLYLGALILVRSAISNFIAGSIMTTIAKLAWKCLQTFSQWEWNSCFVIFNGHLPLDAFCHDLAQESLDFENMENANELVGRWWRILAHWG